MEKNRPSESVFCCTKTVGREGEREKRMCTPSCLFKGDNGGKGGELLLYIIETNKREKIKGIYRKR